MYRKFIVILLILCGILLCETAIFAEELTEEMRLAVEEDWRREAVRLGKDLTSPDEIAALFTQAENVAASWNRLPEALPRSDVSAEMKTLGKLRAKLEKMRSENASAEDFEALYLGVRHVLRRIVLSHPALAGRKIAFLKQRRTTQQMFHEYSGYYYNFFNLHGGGVFVLEKPGVSMEITDLTAGKLPKGTFTSPALSLDGKTIYFAFSRVSEGDRPWEIENPPGTSPVTFDSKRLPAPPETAPTEFSYFMTTRRSFHLFAIETDGTQLRQITQGIFDDTDPCELPDGRVAFMSTRRGGFIRCNSGYEPLETSTLHAVDRDGSNLTQLSWHETDEWGPSLLPDGRIVYTRWDYVDRDATLFHGIWTCNPDGSNPTHLFGSYTTKINAHYQPRAIPGTRKIVCLGGAHHANVGGTLLILDTAKLDRNAEGEDSLEAVECLTPEIGFSEVGGYWAQSFYHSPTPLSEDHFLVAFSYDPLPGMGPGYYRDSYCGLYYFDRFGNKELLYRDADISSVGPMLLPDAQGMPPRPPVIPSNRNPELAAREMGEFHLSSVYLSQFPFSEGRKIKALRIFQLLPKTETCAGNRPTLGFAYTTPARAYLGAVPVEEDGSACFRAPARRPLYFQAIDEEGRAVQGMRSNAYLQPGETRACVGCHEPVGKSVPFRSPSLASRRTPSEILPEKGLMAGPMSFPAMIQPILDRRCISCHGEGNGEGNGIPDVLPDLRGMERETYSLSYENLRPYLRWYEWGKNSISLINSQPGEGGADGSPLTEILLDENHAAIWKEDGSDSDYRQILLWLDANSPFYGTYHPGERSLQKSGQPIAMPDFQ